VLRDEELRAEVLRDEELRDEPPERDDDLREEDDPPLDDLRDDPPLRPAPDFRFESAILVPPPRLGTRQDYATLKRASTGA